MCLFPVNGVSGKIPTKLLVCSLEERKKEKPQAVLKLLPPCLLCHSGLCLRVTVAMTTHHDKSNLGRKGFIWLTLPRCSLSLKEARTGFKQGC